MEKILTQRDILELLKRDRLELPPLLFVRVVGEAPGIGWDVFFEIKDKENQVYRFAADIKARVTAQALAAAAHRAHRLASDAPGLLPLVVVPYLSPASLEEAEHLGISAVDLCGNGVVQVPNRWLVLRSGKPNRFRGSDALRGAYRGVASLIPRAFIMQPTFTRVTDIHKFISGRGGRVTLATVSKALARLEEDLVVAREPKRIRLVQADKLLSKLQASYQPPSIRRKLTLRTKLPEIELHRRLRCATELRGGRLVLTGISSASHQTVIAAEPMISFYCSEPPEELAELAEIPASPQSHFADLELLQTFDEPVYFDARAEGERLLASPVQTWLELITGDKRSQEVAKELARRLLRDTEAESGGVAS